MDPLEQKLKQALEGQDPPEGFADRVLRRCLDQRAAEATASPAPARERPETRPSDWKEWLVPRGWRLALAGSLVVVILGVGIGYRQHQERLRGEKAHAELMLALEITGKQISRVHHVLIGQPGGAQE